MKKIVVILLVLFLFLGGQQGCAPPGEFKPREMPGVPGGVSLRGLSIEFEEGRLSSVPGERLPVIWVGDKVEIGVRITNHMLKPIKGDIHVHNLARYAGGLDEEKSFNIPGGVLWGEEFEPNIEVINFDPFGYTEKVEDSLITEVNLVYDGLVTADLCFNKREEEIAGCNNYETLSENMLGGDSGYLPVSITEVSKQARVEDSTVKFKLIVSLHDFGGGTLKENRLASFSANIRGGKISCKSDVIFRTSRVQIMCEGSANLGDAELLTLPVEFRLGYDYTVVRSMSYSVLKFGE